VLAVTLSLQVAVDAVGLSWADVFRACWPATKATACMLAVTGLLSLCLHRATLVNLIGITIVGAASYTACLALETNASFLELKRAAIADVTEVLKQGKGAR
jgi:hypothetical protein